MPATTFAQHGKFATIWRIVLACSYFHFLLLVPLKTGFFTFAHSSTFDVLDICMDLLLLSNAMIVAPRMQITWQGELITDAQALKRRYFASSDFYLDLFCSFPLDLIIEIVLWSCGPGDEGYELHLMLLRLPKLALLFKFIAFVNKLAYQLSVYVHPNVVRLTNVAIFIFLLLHWIGCGWFLVAHVQGFGSSDFLPSAQFKSASLWEQYMYGMFWALCRMTDSPTPTGAAQTRVERYFQMLVSLTGMTTYASIVGGIAHLIMSLDSKTLVMQQKMEELNAFLRENQQLPEELQHKMRTYYEFKLYHDQNRAEHDLIREFPKEIQAQIVMYRNQQHLSTLLKNWQPQHVDQLALRLQHRVYPSNHTLATIGHIVQHVTIVIKGQVALLDTRNEVCAILGAGSMIGEQGMYEECKYGMHAKTHSLCETLELSKQDFVRFCQPKK